MGRPSLTTRISTKRPGPKSKPRPQDRDIGNRSVPDADSDECQLARISGDSASTIHRELLQLRKLTRELYQQLDKQRRTIAHAELRIARMVDASSLYPCAATVRALADEVRDA